MPLGQTSGFPRTDPGGRVTPRFWHRLIRFRHFIDGLLALASLNLTRRDRVPTLTATLTTIAFDDSSLQRFEACTCAGVSCSVASKSFAEERQDDMRDCIWKFLMDRQFSGRQAVDADVGQDGKCFHFGA